MDMGRSPSAWANGRKSYTQPTEKTHRSNHRVLALVM
jgi:hypothetical protein